jgi:predicted outer membrane repeat protein
MALDSRIVPDAATIGTFDTSIIQPAGPRGDLRFFNVEGKNNTTNASYCVADFDFSTAFTGPVTSFNSISLALAHDDSSFSAAGTFSIFVTGDVTTSMDKGTSPLKCDNTTNDGIAATDFTDRIGVGTFAFAKNSVGGSIDTFNLNLSNPAAVTLLVNQINSTSGGNGHVRLLLTPDNVGTPAVAATYGGLTPRFNYQKPMLTVDANIGFPGQPRAKLGAVPPVTTSGATSYPITVTYSDDTAIKVSTIDGNDLLITGPNSYSALASFVSVDVNTDGTPRVATYSMAAPGGTFDPPDNGTYTVTLQAGQVTDTSNNPVADVTLGKIVVAIPNPQTFVVTNANDTGTGSLRAEIALSNANVGTDTITFDPTFFNTPQSIGLITGELLVTDSVLIDGGNAANVTVDGTGGIRCFEIGGSGGLNVGLSNMTITDAFSTLGNGGAILCTNDNLTVSHCVITANKCSTAGGGISQAVGGTLTILDSTISNNSATTTGAGINADSGTNVVIQRTTISGNTATKSGGGIADYATNFDLESSTVSANTSKNAAGGGGGIFISGNPTSAIVRNSTISGNNATAGDGGGIEIGGTFNGTVLIQNSTIAFNSGSVFGGGIGEFAGTNTLQLRSTIVAQNLSVLGPDIYSKGTPATTVKASYSLIGISDTFTLTDEGNNKLGTTATPLDPMLDVLANNGGPTQTHALLAGSPAINAGANPAALTYDQRGSGYFRVSGASADIGAFEVQIPAAPAKLASIQVNAGQADLVQRSMVTSLTVTFNSHVTFSGAVSAAFTLVNATKSNQPVTIAAATDDSGSGTAVTLTFVGGSVDLGGSLSDGRYNLSILANGFSGAGFDGNGDGIAQGSPIDDFTEVGSPTTGDKLFRYYGDINGDGTVSASDFILFRQFFGGVNPAFDFNGDGSVAASDFIQFRLRFGGSI